MGFRVVFSMWWCRGLLVVPSCGHLGYRLLWFWVFRWVFPRVLPMDVGWG